MRTKRALGQGRESGGLEDHLMYSGIHSTNLPGAETRGGFKPPSVQAAECAGDYSCHLFIVR